MLLLRDQAQSAATDRLAREHAALVREVHQGRANLTEVHGAKLAVTLAMAARSSLYHHTIPGDMRRGWLAEPGPDPGTALSQIFPGLPLLGKRELAAYGSGAFTRPLGEFLHYYESSGTTGDPVAAPKACCSSGRSASTRW